MSTKVIIVCEWCGTSLVRSVELLRRVRRTTCEACHSLIAIGASEMSRLRAPNGPGHAAEKPEDVHRDGQQPPAQVSED